MGALAVAVIAPGCATFDQADVVAKVGDEELTRDELTELVGADDNAGNVRTQIAAWTSDLVVAELIKGGVDPQTLVQTRAAEMAANDAVIADVLRDRSIICLGALQTETKADADAAAAALNDGADFATLLADPEVNINDDLRIAGGIVPDLNDGAECGTSTSANAEIGPVLASMADGEFRSLESDGRFFVIVRRPAEWITPSGRQTLVGPRAVAEIVGSVDVYVDPEFGRWDALQGAVVPLEL